MPGGMNTRVRIHRYTYEDDDVVGGAQPTGTVLYNYAYARIEANPEDQLFMQQGMETERTFNALIAPGTLDIRERDELEIYRPSSHPYYGVHFRIIGVQFSSMDRSNPNNYTRVSMKRSVRSHAIQ